MKEAEKKKVDEIELRSEDFQEVLSDMPPWILTLGHNDCCYHCRNINNRQQYI